MSGLVFIDDENNNVIDEWMNDTGSFVKGDSYDIGEPVTTKGGLGFVETNTGNNKQKEANKKAANKLANKKRTHGDYDDEELHGQVEHIEESRTSFKGKVEKQVEAVNKQKEIGQNNKNKKAKQMEGAKPTNNANTSKDTTSTSDKQALSTNEAPASESAVEKEVRENSRIRKRTKTRSKQKNIRRDNRNPENKPAHLHIGNKDYAGRPLTNQTKFVLGVK